MNKFINNIKFWYKNARPYSIPITFLSWLVIFVYSLKEQGNAILGLISLIGISLVHLATNLADDYFDYKRLIKNEKYLNSTKNIKCKYLKNSGANINDLRNVIIILLLISALSGLILFFTSGWAVIFFALVALCICLLYSKLSSNGLGDIAVILAYGPLMYEGVYYVMTTKLSFNVFILSIATSMMVNTILYAHMYMDYDEDIISNKTTLCTKLKTKKNALNFLLFFYSIGYLMILWLYLNTSIYLYLLTLITIPPVISLYEFLKTYPQKPANLSVLQKFFINKTYINDSFLSRFVYTRNIYILFMLIILTAILF